MVDCRGRVRICSFFAYAHEGKVAANQTGEDQQEQKEEARRPNRFGAPARLFPVLSFLRQFQVE